MQSPSGEGNHVPLRTKYHEPAKPTRTIPKWINKSTGSFEQPPAPPTHPESLRVHHLPQIGNLTRLRHNYCGQQQQQPHNYYVVKCATQKDFFWLCRYFKFYFLRQVSTEGDFLPHHLFTAPQKCIQLTFFLLLGAPFSITVELAHIQQCSYLNLLFQYT